MVLHTKEGWEGNYFVESNYGLLLVDNGAGGSQLPVSEQTINLPVIRTNTYKGCFGETVCPVVRVPTIFCGEIAADNLEVTLDACLHLLGNDVLGNYAYIFDLQRKELIPIEPFQDGISCKLSKQHHLFVQVSLNGLTGWAMVDTGCPITSIDSEFVRASGCQILSRETQEITDASGATRQEDKVLLDGLFIHNSVFPIQPFLLTDCSYLSEAIGFPLIATIGASTMAIKCFSFNPIDGFLKIEDY